MLANVSNLPSSRIKIRGYTFGTKSKINAMLTSNRQLYNAMYSCAVTVWYCFVIGRKCFHNLQLRCLRHLCRILAWGLECYQIPLRLLHAGFADGVASGWPACACLLTVFFLALLLGVSGKMLVREFVL